MLKYLLLFCFWFIGLSVNAQKSEFIHVLDMHQSNGMNAVLVQVRPAADAFYPSQYEPVRTVKDKRHLLLGVPAPVLHSCHCFGAYPVHG